MATAIISVDIESKSIKYYVSQGNFSHLDGIEASPDNSGDASIFIEEYEKGNIKECDPATFSKHVLSGAAVTEIWLSGIPY